MTDRGFYTYTEAGEVYCRVCTTGHGRHDPACPLLELRVQIQELGGQLGLYVATMRELLDAVDGLLRVGTWDATTKRTKP